MKYGMLIGAIFLGMNFSIAQTIAIKDVPKEVVEAVKAKYPTAKIEWEMEGENYEAEFEAEGIGFDVLITPAGKILEIEEEVESTTLPAGATTYLNKNFPGKKIKDAEKVTDAFGKVTYSVEIEDYDYIFDAQGNFLSREDEKVKDPGKN